MLFKRNLTTTNFVAKTATHKPNKMVSLVFAAVQRNYMSSTKGENKISYISNSLPLVQTRSRLAM